MKYIKSFKLHESVVTDSEIESLLKPYIRDYNFIKTKSFHGFNNHRSYRFLDRHSKSQDSFLFIGFPINDDLSMLVNQFVDELSNGYNVFPEKHKTPESIFFVIRISSKED